MRVKDSQSNNSNKRSMNFLFVFRTTLIFVSERCFKDFCTMSSKSTKLLKMTKKKKKKNPSQPLCMSESHGLFLVISSRPMCLLLHYVSLMRTASPCDGCRILSTFITS